MLPIWIAKQALAGDEKHDFIRSTALFLVVKNGTHFKKAILTDVNFSHANLKNTDFSNAYMLRVNLEKVQNLELAKVDGQIFADSDIQDLLVNKVAHKEKSYQMANLFGANLVGADLTDAYFQEGIFNEATLERACLEGSNFSKVQAFGTNFTRAKLTGACVEDWGIDSRTNFHEVHCDYVWLEKEYDKKTGQRKRSPESGFYNPGDFAKLHKHIRELAWGQNKLQARFNQGYSPSPLLIISTFSRA